MTTDTVLKQTRTFLSKHLGYVYIFWMLVNLYLLMSHGWWYFAGGVVLFMGCMVFIMWEEYLYAVQMVETQLWGHPMEYYKDKNIKRPKLKFVWRKKK